LFYNNLAVSSSCNYYSLTSLAYSPTKDEAILFLILDNFSITSLTTFESANSLVANETSA